MERMTRDVYSLAYLEFGSFCLSLHGRENRYMRGPSIVAECPHETELQKLKAYLKSKFFNGGNLVERMKFRYHQR